MSAIISAPGQSRQRILDHIRVATRSVAQNAPQLASAYAALPRTYIRRGTLSAQARIALMIERLREYDAEVVESTPAALPATIAAKLAASGKHIFVVPPGLPAEWLAKGYDWNVDNNLTTAEIELAEGVVTTAFCGVALLPDWHLCILRASQVVETLPEYFDRCQQPPILATTISGPSATADIEMTRIKGVHGPQFLHVILVRDEI
jgi:L-lactate dehydrogenase complex protein LldG